MLGWLAENRDYLLYVILCLALFGSLEAWLRLRRPEGRLQRWTWGVLVAILIAGYFLVDEAGRSESRRIGDFLQEAEFAHLRESTLSQDASEPEEPAYSRRGNVVGGLGLVYPTVEWERAIARERERVMWLLAMPVLMLSFVTATVGVLRAELSARKRIETRLRESEARLTTAIDSIPFDFWVMGMDRRYVLTNSVSRSHWGDCVGKTLGDLGLTPEEFAMWERNSDRAFAGEVVRNEVFQLVDGRRRLLHSIIAPVRVGETVVGILGLNVDLTERFKAEEALRKSEHRFALHFRQTPLAVIEWDTEFCVTAWNPTAERIFGYTATEVLGKHAGPLLILDSSKEQVTQVWQSILERRGGWRNTNENRTKDGRIILCDWHNTPLIDDDGRVIGVASHCEDITQRDILEKHLRQTQKIESLGQLAAGVAHEFNNLLTPMLLRLEMLRGDRAGDSDLLSALRSIGDAIDQAAQLNQRILAVGRRSIEKRELQELNPIVDDTLGLLRHTVDKRILLEVRLAEGLAPLLLDRAQIAQVVVNLTLNARDAVLEKCNAAPAGGWAPRIEISTTSLMVSRPVEGGVGASLPAYPCQRLSVSDNGAGMTDEVRAKVFEPFYTTKPPGQGTGLGLAVVWTVVTNMEGWIEVVSQRGVGTTFHVYLPMQNATSLVIEQSVEAPAPALASPIAGLRILLVDDNVFVADTISRMLIREGHHLTYANNGQEAWSLFSTENASFDLVMTDQNMPVMTGVELVRRMRAAEMKTAAVVFSGYIAPELSKELDSLGVQGVLAKPFTQRELLKMVQSVFSV